MAIAEFVAGWYDTSQRDTLRSCIKKSDDLTNALYDAMDIIIKGEKRLLDSAKVKARKNAVEKMKEFWTLLIPAMADCGQIADDIKAKEKPFQDLLARSDFDEVYKSLYENDEFRIDIPWFFWNIVGDWPLFASATG